MMELKYNISYNSFGFFLVNTILLSYLLEGISIAIMDYLNIIISFSPLTILRYVLFPFSIIVIYKSKYVVFDSRFKLLLLLFCLGLFIKFIIQLNNPLQEIKTLLNYVSPIFMASLVLLLDKHQKKRIFNLLISATFIFAIIAIIQGLFSDLLAESFLEPPQLDKKDLKSKDLIYDFVKMKRPNGLIGNAIEFGFLMNTTLFIILFEKKNKNLKIFTFLLLIITTSILLTLSRAAILQSLVLFLTYFVFYLNFKNKIKSILIITILFYVLVINFGSYSELIYNYVQLTYERIFSTDASSEASNYEHQYDYLSAIEIIKNNIFLGAPLGTNKGSETIITDGSWFHFLLEFGTIIFIIFFPMILRLIKNFIKYSREKFFVTIYFILLFSVGFLNSAIISKINYFVFFMILFSVTKLNTDVKTN